jgi:Flp pilus assembly protein TadG
MRIGRHFVSLVSRLRRSKLVQKKQRGAAALETAIVMPAMILVSLGMANLALAAYCATAATNAANYGARVGSVSQQNPAGRAIYAAEGHASQTGIGDYSVSAYGGGRRGSQIVVEVHWEFENWFRGILAFMGGSSPGTFEGDARSTFRQEGW